MNTLAARYPTEIQAILAKYPPDQKRAAVMPLLYLAQRDKMYITPGAMSEIAEILGISSTDVASIVGFYTLYHEDTDKSPEAEDHRTGTEHNGGSAHIPGEETRQQNGKYRIQVCTDLPCALRGAEQFLAQLCENIGIKVGETTPDGQVTIEQVTCLAGCDRAPMFQLQSGEGLSYHENQTVESALALVNRLRAGEPPQDGTNVVAAMISTEVRRNGHE